MAAAIQGWHPGETAIQRRLGFADAVSEGWRNVAPYMPDQHRLFHTSNLHLIPVTTTDEEGRPWAAIMAGPGGTLGFANSPTPQTLSITGRLWDGDPLINTVAAWNNGKLLSAEKPERLLTAGLGIEFSTRRRNKFAGQIRNIYPMGDSNIRFDININEALGNCPKYINVYKLVPVPRTQPRITHQVGHLKHYERLPQEVIEFILNADTVFVASIYKSPKESAEKFPSHAGMNARSGLPGFMRVSPSNGRTIVLPDYSGNRFVSSLGNIEATGLVGFTIVSFTTGDVLYLTGTAENVVGPDALGIMSRHAAITVMKVTGFTFVKEALPFRQQYGTPVERSPYSPKIKYLVEESGAKSNDAGAHNAELESIKQLSDDLAVFRFNVSSHDGAKRLRIRPGQAIALDFMNWIGPPRYQHMSNAKPSLINDDRVRTWTVSSSHESGDISWFELTMHKVPGGTVTGALFDELRESNNQYGSLFKPKKAITAEIVGVTGDFFLGEGKVDALWVAGGIGVTPFFAMLSAMTMRTPAGGSITLALSTREPEIMIDVLTPLLTRLSSEVRIRIDIFTNLQGLHLNFALKESQRIYVHHGRIPAEYWREIADNKGVFICGPNGFGDSAVDGLRAAGVGLERIWREGFY